MNICVLFWCKARFCVKVSFCQRKALVKDKPAKLGGNSKQKNLEPFQSGKVVRYIGIDHR